jgi:acyl-coenzyme A thioesterase PaaI-like protein
MDNREIAAVDEAAVKEAFETALRTYRPDFETFFLARLFGLEIAYGPESCVVEVPVRDFLYNPQGSVHGGVMAFALDVSMGHWIKHSTGRAGVTLEMKIQYLRPATASCSRFRPQPGNTSRPERADGRACKARRSRSAHKS